MIALSGIVWRWLIGTALGNVVGLAVVFAVLWSANSAWQRSIGADRVITSSVKQGEKANEKNARIREQTKRPGAFERLLRDSCRDC